MARWLVEEEMTTVASLWVGSSPGPYQRLAMKSFTRLGYEYSLYTYQDFDGLPSGVTQRDAREIVPESLLDWTQLERNNYALFADFFRYRLLTQENHVWVDSDVIALREFRSNEGFILGHEGPGRVNNAVLGLPQKSELANYLLKESRARFDLHSPWGALGPRLLTEAVRRLNLWRFVQPETSFYGVPMRQAWTLFDADYGDHAEARVAKSSAVHLWNEILGDSPPQLRTHLPPDSSFLGKIIREWKMEHLFEFPPFSTSTLEWERWKRGIDPYDQSATMTMKIRDLVTSLPSPLRVFANRSADALRRLIDKGQAQ